jgi:hypothetical protein
MFYYLYQITNLVNNKIYVGVHKTKNMNDGYMGSGKIIRYAIEKYGIDNFRKDILETFENSESMYAREKEIVTDNFLLREDVYNLRRGGHGGFDHINSTGKNIYGKNGDLNHGGKNLSNHKGNKKLIDILKEKKTYEDYKRAISNSLKKKYNDGFINPFAGKKHTEDTKKIIQEKLRIAQQGSKNSQFNTCWIYHELFGTKKIKKDLIDEYIFQGWFAGKKLKKLKDTSAAYRKNVKRPHQQDVEKLELWHNLYKTYGYDTFCEITGYNKSKPNLVTLFSKYVKSFVPQNGKKR